MDKQTAIYCRVSTEQQSTDRQKDELLKYATEKGLSVADDRIYIDYTSGFKKGELRPSYSKMKSEVENGNIDIILFSEFTRMSRSANDLLQEIEYFREHNVTTYFHKQDLWIKTDDKIRTKVEQMTLDMALHMLAVIAQYEIELFDERTVSGKINKIKTKGNGGGLERAYGYMHNENKEIIVNEEERQIVVRIFQLYADGYSSIQICDVLNSEGVPPPYTNRIKKFKENRKKKGLDPKIYEHFDVEALQWRPSSLNRILHNELYIGIKSITMFKPDPTNTTPRHKRKDRGTPILDYHEKDEELRIIDDELFQRVQERLATAAYNKNNAFKHENLLKAKLICGECGSNFSVGKQSDITKDNNRGTRTYKCYGRVNRKDKPQTCQTGAEIRQWRLDGLVLTLSLQMFAIINIEDSTDKQIEKLFEEIASDEKIRDNYQQQLTELEENSLSGIMTELQGNKKKGKNNALIIQAVNQINDAYEQQKSKLIASIDKKNQEITRARITIEGLRKLAKEFVNLKDKMDEIWYTKELVKSMIDEYINRITIYKVDKLWNLVIVKYNNETEFWGTIKSARYKKNEMFFDPLLCQHGIEYQAWMLNNTEHCFHYDKVTRKISYNGQSKLYSFAEGDYTYEQFDEILHTNKWIGSYPLYDYEFQSTCIRSTEEPKPDFLSEPKVISSGGQTKSLGEQLEYIKKHPFSKPESQ